jgi:hypothetical protein
MLMFLLMFLSTIQSIQSMLTRCADNLSVLHVFPSHMMYGCRAPAYLGTSTVAEFPSPFFQHQINLQRLSDDDHSPFPAARSTSYSTRKFVSVVLTVMQNRVSDYSPTHVQSHFKSLEPPWPVRENQTAPQIDATVCCAPRQPV